MHLATRKKKILNPKTHLSVSATGDDLKFLWMVAHSPEQCVGNHHLTNYESPIKDYTRDKRQEMTGRKMSLTGVAIDWAKNNSYEVHVSSHHDQTVVSVQILNKKSINLKTICIYKCSEVHIFSLVQTGCQSKLIETFLLIHLNNLLVVILQRESMIIVWVLPRRL